MKSIITFIIVFAVIVIVHEFGHFFFAKRSGILVREFAIGMGPKIFYHRGKDGTAYTVRLLPLGGYVRMAGLGDDDTEVYPGTPLTIELNDKNEVQRLNLSHKVQLTNGIPMEVVEVDMVKELFIEGHVNGNENDLERFTIAHDATVIEQDGTEILIAPEDVQFHSAKLWQRMLTNFAGPMNNFILGIILFIVLAFLQGGVQVTNTNAIGETLPGRPAATAGLKEGDKILSIDGKKVNNWEDLSTKINANANKVLKLAIDRDGKKVELTVTPDGKKGEGQIGVKPPFDDSFIGKITGGFKQAWSMSLMIFKALGGLITGFSLNKLGGPVMIFEMSRQAASQGLPAIIAMMAMLSMNLGIMNLIPIPALDGGKLLLNIIEAIRGKALSPEKEGILSLVGFGIMLLLMVLVTWNDIQRFFFR
ncbi:MAG: RIP metalloprotease RseP [Lactobacillales bacterium]|jgi:regulator of sigma E protease|nr:RIP metalloprotease RseP [Lactobacillales bacterium]